MLLGAGNHNVSFPHLAQDICTPIDISITNTHTVHQLLSTDYFFEIHPIISY